MPVNRIVRHRFRVKPHDNLPHCGWRGTREILATIFAEAGFNHGAEIGVQEGIYSEILCKANPNLKLKCIDIWQAFSRTTNAMKASKHYTNAKQRLTQYGVEFMKMSSMDAAKIVPDGSLDFVYIDAAHDFDNVMLDIIHWSPKVRSGGIVSGHDYYKGYECDVMTAVDAYTKAHNINPWYITNTMREPYPSWCWVKP